MSKFQVLTKLWQKMLFFANLKDTVVRDGPFDIWGGGAGIFPRDKLFFFFLFAQQVIFFQSRPKLQQDFFFK